MDGLCASQLKIAKGCIDADPDGACSCFVQPFETNFPESVAGAYRTTMAFEIPGTEEFCPVANREVCKMFDAEAYCCCQQETNDYIACEFENTLGPKFGCAACEATGCGDAANLGRYRVRGGTAMYDGIIIGAVIVVLILCCSLVYYYHRREHVLLTDEPKGKKNGRNELPTTTTTVRQFDVDDGQQEEEEAFIKEGEAPGIKEASTDQKEANEN